MRYALCSPTPTQHMYVPCAAVVVSSYSTFGPVATSPKNCFHLQIYLLRQKIRNDNNNGMEKIKETLAEITLVHTKLNSSSALCAQNRVQLGFGLGGGASRAKIVRAYGSLFFIRPLSATVYDDETGGWARNPHSRCCWSRWLAGCTAVALSVIMVNISLGNCLHLVKIISFILVNLRCPKCSAAAATARNRCVGKL